MVKMTKKYYSTNNEEIDANYMKIAVQSFFRYKKQYKLTCTEYCYKDVVAFKGSDFIEVEVKISKSDLKADLHKPKHKKYVKGSETQKANYPNEFYYAFPKELYQDEEVKEIVEKLNPKYGIIIVKDIYDVMIVKFATKLHDIKFRTTLKDDVIARLTSENINLRQKLYNIQHNI